MPIPLPAMSPETRSSRLLGLATAVTLALGVNACGSLDPVNTADVVVMPLEIDGTGFTQTKLSADHLEQRTKESIAYFNQASDNSLGKLSVAAAKPKKVHIDGVNKPEDLCTREGQVAFFTGTNQIPKFEQTAIFVINATEGQGKCLPLALEGGIRRLLVTSDKELNKKNISHELGHTKELNHNNTWECPKPAVIDTSCTSVPYGDWTKIMGYESETYDNAEPLTAFQLFAIGKLDKSQIVRLDGTQPNKSQTVELSLPSKKDGKAKAISISLGNSIDGLNPQSDAALRCANALVLEIGQESHTNEDGTISDYPGLKAYTQSSRAGAPEATLVKLGSGKNEYAWWTLKPVTMLVGGVTVKASFENVAPPARPGDVSEDVKVTFTTSYKKPQHPNSATLPPCN